MVCTAVAVVKWLTVLFISPSSECEVSEDSSGEAELEAEQETSDQEDIRDLHPGALLYKASKARNLPVMAEALAHGADINLINDEDEGKTPLIQAVIGVSWTGSVKTFSHISVVV